MGNKASNPRGVEKEHFLSHLHILRHVSLSHLFHSIFHVIIFTHNLVLYALERKKFLENVRSTFHETRILLHEKVFNTEINEAKNRNISHNLTAFISEKLQINFMTRR